MKIAVLYIATGKYYNFFKSFYESSERYFLTSHSKDYYVFTDSDSNELSRMRNVRKIYQEHCDWPYITLLRYRFFNKISIYLKNYDYIFFCNANSIFLAGVNEEILPGKDENYLVASSSNPFIFTTDNKKWTYERNPNSTAYIKHGDGDYYFRGGFNGGSSDAYLDMTNELERWIDLDLKNKIIAVWHDESYINKYLNQRDVKVLNPSYAYAEEWRGVPPQYYPIIMMRDKSKFFNGKFYTVKDRIKNFWDSCKFAANFFKCI